MRSLLGLRPIVKEVTGKFMETVKRKKRKSSIQEVCNFLNIYFFQGISLGLKQFVLLFIETGFINTILSKINFISSKFLLSAICSLIFLQLKGGKRQTLWIEKTKLFVLCFAIIFSIKTPWEREKRQKRTSAKSDNSKVLFPDIKDQDLKSDIKNH